MFRLLRFFAAVLLIVSVVAFAPGNAEARWGGGGQGGDWHGGDWSGGGGDGGWGSGPVFGWGWGRAFGWAWGPGLALGWGSPYVYSVGPRCGWVPIQAWRNGRRVLHRAWRCW